MAARMEIRSLCSIIPGPGESLINPADWRNDYVAVEQFSRSIVRGHYVALVALHRQHQQFALQWDNNLRLQGFLEAFSDRSIRG
jgi:hypothetical protein